MCMKTYTRSLHCCIWRAQVAHQPSPICLNSPQTKLQAGFLKVKNLPWYYRFNSAILTWMNAHTSKLTWQKACWAGKRRNSLSSLKILFDSRGTYLTITGKRSWLILPLNTLTSPAVCSIFKTMTSSMFYILQSMFKASRIPCYGVQNFKSGTRYL